MDSRGHSECLAQKSERRRVSFVPAPPLGPKYKTGEGSRLPSKPLSYTIEAAICSQNGKRSITQDELDTIRQEYENLKLASPSDAARVVVPEWNDFNSGGASVHFTSDQMLYNNPYVTKAPYNQVANVTLDHYHELADDVWNEYNRLLGTPGVPGKFPLDAGSTWRNPQRNEVSSLAPYSMHVRGRAVDLEPLKTAFVPGKTRQQLMCVLYQAGLNLHLGQKNKAIPDDTELFAEVGNDNVDDQCIRVDVDHIHFAR